MVAHCACAVFIRPPPRPVVGLPTASTFNECVAMDLKFFEGKIILHLIDHVTRLSSASRVSSKNPELIVKSIFKNWIAVYGSPLKKLSDNKNYIKFPCLDVKTLHVKSFSDSSFNNLSDGGSQGGYIIFLCDDNANCCPIE